MGTNLVGPFGTGVNQTYEEPSFPDSGDSQFSWFVDCSDDVTPDGTKWMANWANRMMQQIRRAVVGMGVTPTETDGDALQKAIMRAHRPIVNIGGGIGIHKGEKMPEWQHELRSLEGAGTVSINVVGDKIVITGAAGSSVTLQSLGTGVPVYKGISGSVHQFRSLMADAGIAVVEGTTAATFRLAPIDGWSIMLRNGASADVPTGVPVDGLTEETAPHGDDLVLLQRSASRGRQLRNVKVSKLRGLWEIAAQVELSGTLSSIALDFEADRYSQLVLAFEDLRFSTYQSGTTDALEVALMNGSSVLHRRPYWSRVEFNDVNETRIYEINGRFRWELSSRNNRGCREIERTIFDLVNPDDRTQSPMSATLPTSFITHGPPGFETRYGFGATPINRIRLRHLDFDGVVNPAGSYSVAAGFTAGLVTLYGLTRG